MRPASMDEIPRSARIMLKLARAAGWTEAGVTYARGFTATTRAGTVSREVESLAVRLLAGDGTRLAMVWWGGRIETVLVRDERGTRKTDLTNARLLIQLKADENRAHANVSLDEGDNMPRIMHMPPAESKTIEPRTYTVAPVDWARYADGAWREFTQGTPHEVHNGTADFVGKPSTVAGGVRRWAKAHGSTGRITVSENAVKVVLTRPTHPNGDALKPVEQPAEQPAATIDVPTEAVDPFALTERF